MCAFDARVRSYTFRLFDMSLFCDSQSANNYSEIIIIIISLGCGQNKLAISFMLDFGKLTAVRRRACVRESVRSPET